MNVRGVEILAQGKVLANGAVQFKTAFPLYGPGVYVAINGEYFPIPDAEARSAFLDLLSDSMLKIKP